jgi:hypothetical protein
MHPSRRPFAGLACLLACLALAGCGTELSGPGETLRILSAPLEPAYLNEPYAATLRVVGGLTPYTFEVSRGSLPPGITLQGAALRGVPTQEGEYAFTITVADGNLSRTFQEFALSVVVPPPASLSLNAPATEIQRSVTLRGTVAEARDLEGLRTLIRWDAARFELVPDSVAAASDRYALFYEAAPGQLQLDLAVLGSTLQGERALFSFALQPLEVSTLSLEVATEFIGARGHAFTRTQEGAPSGLAEPAEDGDPDEFDPDEFDADEFDPDEFDPDAFDPDEDDFDPDRTE